MLRLTAETSSQSSALGADRSATVDARIDGTAVVLSLAMFTDDVKLNDSIVGFVFHEVGGETRWRINFLLLLRNLRRRKYCVG